MRGWNSKQNIKNSGMLMAFFTFFGGMWHMLTNMGYTVFDSPGDIALRVCGLVLITVLAYMPYDFLCYLITKISHEYFFVGFGSVFLLTDVFLRVIIFLGGVNIGGFTFVALYSFGISALFCFSVTGVWLAQHVEQEKQFVARIYYITKKNVDALLHRKEA